MQHEEMERIASVIQYTTQDLLNTANFEGTVSIRTGIVPRVNTNNALEQRLLIELRDDFGGRFHFEEWTFDKVKYRVEPEGDTEGFARELLFRLFQNGPSVYHNEIVNR